MNLFVEFLKLIFLILILVNLLIMIDLDLIRLNWPIALIFFGVLILLVLWIVMTLHKSDFMSRNKLLTRVLWIIPLIINPRLTVFIMFWEYYTEKQKNPLKSNW